jgi:hypothetical protein
MLFGENVRFAANGMVYCLQLSNGGQKVDGLAEA